MERATASFQVRPNPYQRTNIILSPESVDTSSGVLVHEHETHYAKVVYSLFGLPTAQAYIAFLRELCACFLVSIVVFGASVTVALPQLGQVAAIALAYGWAMWHFDAVCDPFISLAFLLTGRRWFWVFLCEVAGQVLGWFLGGLFVWSVMGNFVAAAPPPLAIAEWVAFLLEMVSALIITLCYLQPSPIMAIAARAACGIVFVSWTGCIVNPLRALVPQIYAVTWTHAWLWYVGPLVGILVASVSMLVVSATKCWWAASEESCCCHDHGH